MGSGAVCRLQSKRELSSTSFRSILRSLPWESRCRTFTCVGIETDWDKTCFQVYSCPAVGCQLAGGAAEQKFSAGIWQSSSDSSDDGVGGTCLLCERDKPEELGHRPGTAARQAWSHRGAFLESSSSPARPGWDPPAAGASFQGRVPRDILAPC